MKLLEGEREQLAIEILSALAARLSEGRGDGGSWSDGAAGVAVFYSECERVRALPGSWAEASRAHLESAIAALEAQPLPAGLFGGVAGIAWAVAYVQGDDAKADDTNELDRALIASTSDVPYVGPIDLMGGLAGIGVYALERSSTESGRALLQAVVERLSETCAEGGGWKNDLRWLPPRYRQGRSENEYDVGVAHGAGGVLPVLSAAMATGVARPLAARAYERTRDWLLSSCLADEAATFPALVVPGHAPRRTRSAWCYGDPGMAATLHAAAVAADDTELAARALGIAEKALRRPLPEWGVVDAGLCHGAAGVAHCYQRLYRRSGRELFRRATLAWLDVVFARFRAHGLAGLRAWDERESPAAWREATGVLEGLAGVGLVLLSALSEAPLGWDRPFALSTRLEEVS